MSVWSQSRMNMRKILRLAVASVSASGAALAAAPVVAQPGRLARRTFVLVHGAWHGGWYWRRVADILEAGGHKVYTPTLTGLGERSHLMNIDTHITDVVNLFKWENLESAVLCGHSYGGWVISGAIEQLLPQVSSIVFLDAFMPEDGQTAYDLAAERNREQIAAAVKEGRIHTPALSAELFKVNERDRAWVDAKMTPQPIGVWLQKIRLTGSRDRVAKKTYIRATNYPQPTFDKFFATTKADPTWRTYEVPCGHNVMIDMPRRLAEILLEVA
jgi:pimeloyl-ACP methyl ester carboxylesterase